MKILLISNMYPTEKNPYYGVFVRNMELSLEEHGVKFDKVISIEEVDGSMGSIRQKILKYLKFIIIAYKKILLSKYDLIYIHNITHSVFFLTPLLRLKNTKYVMNAHGSDVFPKNRIDIFLKKLCFETVQKANMIVVPSTYFKKIINTEYKHKNIFISPSGGVNLKRFYPDFQPKTLFTIGTVLRIDANKGWDIFLDSIAAFRKKHPEIEFNVRYVGRGTQVEEFITMINKLGLTDMIEYLGFKPQSELATIYRSLDVFLFPTTRLAESLGLVGVESMACGTPVIGSNIGGLTDYIVDGKTGFLFEPGNVDELVNKIYQFYSLSNDKKIQMRHNAFKKSKEFDATFVGQKLYEKLKSLHNEN